MIPKCTPLGQNLSCKVQTHIQLFVISSGDLTVICELPIPTPTPPSTNLPWPRIPHLRKRYKQQLSGTHHEAGVSDLLLHPNPLSNLSVSPPGAASDPSVLVSPATASLLACLLPFFISYSHGHSRVESLPMASPNPLGEKKSSDFFLLPIKSYTWPLPTSQVFFSLTQQICQTLSTSGPLDMLFTLLRLLFSLFSYGGLLLIKYDFRREVFPNLQFKHCSFLFQSQNYYNL